MLESQEVVLLSAPDAVDARLEELRLTAEVIRRAVIDGESARVTATRFHPKSAAGYKAWCDCVASLRDGLVPGEGGWQQEDPSALPLVVNREVGIRIAVTAGDELTGMNGVRGPRTKNDKGSMVQMHVEINRWLPFHATDLQALTGHSRPSKELTTWILLVNSTFDVKRPERPHVVRFELSRPRGLDPDNHISQWWERILFPSLNIDELSQPPEDQAEESVIDVPVSRRA